MSWNNLYLPYAWDVPIDYPPISTPLDAQSIPSSSPPSVKIEPDDPDSRFIMELAASSSRSSPDSYPYTDPVPPTEVPLRATQASKEMRRMMGVFRLNPFAMHSLSRGGDSEGSSDVSPTTASATWCGEAGPLEEEPVMFEFQLDISSLDREDDGPVIHAAEPSSRLPAITAHDESQLRAFSPSFELQEGDPPEGREGPPSGSRFDIQHDVDPHHAVSEQDPGSHFRHAHNNDPWEEVEYAPQGSDSGASSSTTVSVQTPLNESRCSPFDNGTMTHVRDHLAHAPGCAEQTQASPTVEFSSRPLWEVPDVSDNYQVQESPGAGPSVNYGYTDMSHQGGMAHPNNSHSGSYMRMTYPPPLYTRRPYAQLNAQFQQAQGQPDFFLLSMPTNHAPSLLHNARPPSVHESSPSQEIEPVPQSPSTLSPLSPATPNSLQYPSFNQQHNHYQSQQHSRQHEPQMPVYSPSNPVTPTSMPLRLPISVARSAMRSAAAYSNAGSPTSCHSQLPPPSPYGARGYRISRRPHLEERIGEHEVYSTPHSPINEEYRDRYVPTNTVNMGIPISAPMHPVLQRSSTYTSHPVPQLVTGGAVASSQVHLLPNTNSRRWSLPEMSVGAQTPVVGQGESFLGHHM